MPASPPDRHARALATSARWEATRGQFRQAAPSPVARTPSAAPRRGAASRSPTRTASRSPTRSTARAVRAVELDGTPSPTRSGATYSWKDPAGTLSTPTRAVVEGGVVERVLGEASPPPPSGAGAPALPQRDAPRARTPKRYHVNVSELAAQRTPEEQGGHGAEAAHSPSVALRLEKHEAAALAGRSPAPSQGQQGSTARALLAGGMRASEHAAHAAASDRALQASLHASEGEGGEREQVLGATEVEIWGGHVPAYRLQKYEQIDTRARFAPKIFSARDFSFVLLVSCAFD